MRIASLLLILMSAPTWAELPSITVEAESYIEVTGGTVRILDREVASGGKCVSYWEEPGVAVTIGFEVVEAGDYCLTLRYSLNWDDTRRGIALDGETVPGLANVTLPGTGSWNDFSAITIPGSNGERVRLSLTPGAHTLTLTNVDSRGLGWDAAVLHDPALLLADAPLSEAELRELAAKLPLPASRLLLDGPREGDLVIGELVMAYEAGALTTAHRLGEWFFTPGEFESMPAAIHVADHKLGGLLVRRRWLEIGNGQAFTAIDITDGANLYRLGVTVNIEGTTGSVALPIIEWREGTPWLLTPPTARPEDGAATIAIGGLLMSVSSPFNAAAVPVDPVARLELGFGSLVVGTTAVFAAKTGPAITPGDSSIHAEVAGDEVVIRSSREMWPTLAKFYGLVQFACRVHADGSMTITCEGEELALPAP